MESPVTYLRYALLVVLLAPLVAAAMVSMLGGRLPRKFASVFAVVHLGLTVLLTFVAFHELEVRNEHVLDAERLRHREEPPEFQPIFVPGDPGFPGDANSQTYETTWTLLSFGKR